MAELHIKASEAARRIGVSLVTAKRMIKDGRLVGQKIGSRWQVTEQSVFDYLGKDQAEVDRSEEEVNKIGVVSTVSTAQNQLEPIQNSSKTAGSGSVASSVGPVGHGDGDISRAHNARERADGDLKFPEHPLLVDEFGHMFGAIQLDAEQFFVNCLRFLDDHLWVYWRPSSSQYALEELSYHLKGSAPIVDLLSMSLFDVVKWVISRNVFGGSRYDNTDYQQGMWRVELRRESSQDADGDQLYRRCAYSYPFEFRFQNADWSEAGGIYPIENDVTGMILRKMSGGGDGS
jgi:excisionase family DNA binding protein